MINLKKEYWIVEIPHTMPPIIYQASLDHLLQCYNYEDGFDEFCYNYEYCFKNGKLKKSKLKEAIIAYTRHDLHDCRFFATKSAMIRFCKNYKGHKSLEILSLYLKNKERW